MSEEMIPVVIRYADYRGDHAADAQEVLLIHPTTTLARLEEVRANYSKYGATEIRIVGSRAIREDGE